MWAVMERTLLFADISSLFWSKHICLCSTGWVSLIQNAWDQECFRFQISLLILEYYHVHNDISWERDPSLNTKFTYISYLIHIPWGLFYTIFLVQLDFDCNQSDEVRCGIFHSWHCVNQLHTAVTNTWKNRLIMRKGLVCSYRGFSLWSVGSISLGLWQPLTVGVHEGANLFSWQGREKGRVRDRKWVRGKKSEKGAGDKVYLFRAHS
jgi:hypothetical protein